jgi:hypothetical protein
MTWHSVAFRHHNKLNKNKLRRSKKDIEMDHGNVNEVDSEEMFEILLTSAEDRLVSVKTIALTTFQVVVDFFATWCGK